MLRARIANFLHDTSGVAVIEFALIGPTLLFMLLAAIDIGTVLVQREAMDHVLRSGAQLAMEDKGAASVLDAMTGTTTGQFSTTPGAANSIVLNASRFCACPNTPATATACGTICTGNLPTNIYYRMTASKTHNGILLPQFNLNPVLQVQIR